MQVEREAIFYMQHAPHLASFNSIYSFVEIGEIGLMHEIGIEFVQEEFAEEGRIFFVHNGHGNVEGVGTDADTEENHLDGGKSELEEEYTKWDEIN